MSFTDLFPSNKIALQFPLVYEGVQVSHNGAQRKCNFTIEAVKAAADGCTFTPKDGLICFPQPAEVKFS